MITRLVKILDKGSITLQDVMGNDLSIVNAARVSYLGESKGDTKDKKLLLYLMEHNHTSPFEMVEFKFRVKCPLFVARQWMSHRTWSYNEVSRRYTSENIEFYIPEKWRRQDIKDKQASSGYTKSYSKELLDITNTAMGFYNEAIKNGVAREQARLFLPVCMYTEFIGKVDAHNLMKFLILRMSNHAQYEIRLYARAICHIFLKENLPWTYEGFNGNDIR